MTTATQKKTPTPEKTLESLSQRDQSIVKALRAGEERSTIASKYGLTPERVRQISTPFLSGDHQQTLEETRRQAKEARRQERLAEVTSLAKKDPSLRVSAIATQVGGGITSQDVIAVIGEKDALRRDQIRFTENPVFTQKFTDEDCFKALRKASKRVAKEEGKEDGEHGVLTMVLYSENSDEDDPKQSTIQKRFGTWQSACKLAGVPSGEPIPKRVYKKKWSDEEMVQIVKRFFTEVGVFGSMRQYGDWALGVPGTPTLATVRSHFGSWTNVKKIAADMAESK